MKIPLQLLVIHESDLDLKNILYELEAGGYQPHFEKVDSQKAFGQALKHQNWDAVIADDDVQSEFDATVALAYMNKSPYDIPFIVVSGKGGEENAVQAMRDGAHDYILKSCLKRLVPALEREIREVEIRQARKHADETINQLSHSDQLTGLPNRIVMYDKLQQHIDTAQREQKKLALLIMDLDRFKDVNDTIGHYFGDLLLQQVANRLMKVAKGTTALARMGGDEFAILIADADQAEAINMARDIVTVFDSPFQLHGHKVIIGASVGIAMYPLHGVYADTLLQHADVAMYRAKYASSDYAVYDEATDSRSAENLSLVDELEHAIADHQLILHYQPVIDIQSRRVDSVEALVRWQHPRFGELSPQEFIPTAEQTSVIRSLSNWVLDSAISQLAEWHKNGILLNLAVNLPVRSLHDLKLHEKLTKLLGTYGITPDHLSLEITERTMMVDWLDATQMVRRIANLGVRFTLDDFGTGHFSLGHLKKLPIDTLKIDKSFVTGMADNKDHESIIRAAVALGHCMGLSVLAEGVENRDIWDLLVVHQCDKVQGNLVAEPMLPEAMAPWIKNSPWFLESKAKVG